MNVHKGRFILDKKLNLKESKITLNFNAIKSGGNFINLNQLNTSDALNKLQYHFSN